MHWVRFLSIPQNHDFIELGVILLNPLVMNLLKYLLVSGGQFHGKVFHYIKKKKSFKFVFRHIIKCITYPNFGPHH